MQRAKWASNLKDLCEQVCKMAVEDSFGPSVDWVERKVLACPGSIKRAARSTAQAFVDMARDAITENERRMERQLDLDIIDFRRQVRRMF